MFAIALETAHTSNITFVILVLGGRNDGLDEGAEIMAEWLIHFAII
jgi:hypothetical protein